MPSLDSLYERILYSLGSARLAALWRAAQPGCYLEAKGWLASRKLHRSVDAAGAPIPWLCYGAVAFLEERLRPSMKMFEWGAGASTAWFAARVAHVTSCEHHAGWHRRMKQRVPANVTMLHEPGLETGAYAQAVLRDVNNYSPCYDVILIDGRERVACANAATQALSEGGVIIWDNTERPRYAPGFTALKFAGFRELSFSGLGPISPKLVRTTIYYRPGNCFGI